MNDDYHVEFLAWHLERADAHANELGLTRVVERLRRLRQIAPDVPERAPEPDPMVRTGPRTIEHRLTREAFKTN